MSTLLFLLGSFEFTCCSRRIFLILYATARNIGHAVIIETSLRRLRRYLFTYLRYKIFESLFDAFGRALFGLCVFILISFNFSY